MSDELTPDKPNGLMVTHKQIGWGGGILGAIMIMSQMKTVFVPVEKSLSQDAQIASVAKNVDDFKVEFRQAVASQDTRLLASQSAMEARLKENINRLSDILRQNIKDSEERNAHAMDANSRRIDSVEIALRNAKGYKTSTSN